MIERVIEWSIRNRLVVWLLAGMLTLAGVYAALTTPVDAIPDLSENQVIVFADWMGRSPREIEDQVTYPLARKLQGLAGIRAVRASSEFNFAMITLIFDDGVDFYFARQRVTEKLLQAATFLPQGVVPYLAPDATALGQVFWYTVEASPDQPQDPSRLWALNKFYIAPQLNAAEGVADVAIVGGMPVEYQIDVRPEDLRAYGVTLGELYQAIVRSNLPSGGGVLQKGRAEYVIRGVGWLDTLHDLERIVIREKDGVPLYVRQVARVQRGPGFRRSVLEKNGSEVTGGVVLMRHGENPLAVTRAIEAKIAQLQPGLPPGVRIVPAYDRTRLIHGAIHTLLEVMGHEMLIAAAAILLILRHLRSVLVICLTLPLAVLSSFLLMAALRQAGILDVQANIMSLAGITISIGVLVDQAIVMTENATHALRQHYGSQPIQGDTTPIVLAACRTVGRPIFFSVMIMLLSFVPVFLLSGREGKLFHPLAYTKTFALVGVAVLSVTLVPALLPAFLRGRLKSEEENWIVRSFIQIYRPLLTWALPRRNLVMWLFAALLILAAGMFPLQALVGQGASQTAWRQAFLATLAVVSSVTVVLTRGLLWQAVALASLLGLGVWAYHFPKIGVSFMPPLNEGTLLDMPVTVPRASVTQVADDLKARDALLRGFPEVELVVGKAGRAETPTDPAPLDMVETFVQFRPRAYWPKRVLRYPDALRQTQAVFERLVQEGFLTLPLDPAAQQNLGNDATQAAIARLDEYLRELAVQRYEEVQRTLAPRLVRTAVATVLEELAEQGVLRSPTAGSHEPLVETLLEEADLVARHGRWLVSRTAREEVELLIQQVLAQLRAQKWLAREADSGQGGKTFRQWPREMARWLMGRPHDLVERVRTAIDRQRDEHWRAEVRSINGELFDRGVEAYTWLAIQEVLKAARGQGVVTPARRAADTERFLAAVEQIEQGRSPDPAAVAPLEALRTPLEEAMRSWCLLWPRTIGPRGDLIDDEMGRVLQVPGWSNIFTQPIINRIEMLSTGVRTDIGVKVFGPDLETIDRVCRQIEAVLRTIPGARDVVAAPIMGKGYLEITLRREEAARYGITSEDVQRHIELALGGQPATYLVWQRDRFPVRLRYARASREDEESLRRILISPGTMPAAGSESEMAASPSPAATPPGMEPASPASLPAAGAAGSHRAAPPHLPRPVMVPLSAVADVRVVEGPAMIRSENGQLLNYVTLNVRGRDIVGFVEQAQRAVAQSVPLPEGVSLQWSGEFEHQVRAARTLRIVLPAVIGVIFLILYLTYHDLADAALMMLAVPEALAGGAFFLYLFPKLTQGWSAPPLDFSVAVWVGFIACFGMATETGIIMLVYLREAIDRRGGLENIASLEELRQAVLEGAVHRLRPKLLTEGVAIVAIFPMVFASGVGGEILAPMALPVLGGLLISDEVVDLFLPVRFYWVRRARWLKLHAQRRTMPAEAT
jgi:Cu(I)/Ag(I) efflux system membrane protein CusA/SilA